MLTLQFYTRAACSLCESAWHVVKRVQQRIPFHLERIDIDDDPELQRRYGHVIPVVMCEDRELARSFIDEKTLLSELEKIAPNS